MLLSTTHGMPSRPIRLRKKRLVVFASERGCRAQRLLHRLPTRPRTHVVDRRDDLVKMSLVAGRQSFTLDAGERMAPAAVASMPHSFPVDDHTALAKQVAEISGAEREPMIAAGCVGKGFSREAGALLVRNDNGYFLPNTLVKDRQQKRLSCPARALPRSFGKPRAVPTLLPSPELAHPLVAQP